MRSALEVLRELRAAGHPPVAEAPPSPVGAGGGERASRPHLGAICRRARSYPHALALLLDALGIRNGARLPPDFYGHGDALRQRWDTDRGGSEE